MPFDQDTESQEPPSSSVLSEWLVLGVELPLKTLSLWNLLRFLYCQGGWYLASQHKCHIFQSTWEQNDVLDQRTSVAARIGRGIAVQAS